MPSVLSSNVVYNLWDFGISPHMGTAFYTWEMKNFWGRKVILMEPRCNHKYIYKKERDAALTRRGINSRSREESKVALSQMLVAARRSWEIFPRNSGVSMALSTPPVHYCVSLWCEHGETLSSNAINFVENCYHSCKKLTHPPEYVFVIINLLRLRVELKLEPDL